MLTTVATLGKFELITNGNHQYWVRPVSGANRNRYKTFAGRTLESAMISLEVSNKLGY